MPPSSRQSLTKGRWRAVALSLFVHGLIIAAAVLGWFTWKHEPPPTTLAIDATVVDERALKGANKLPEVAPEPPPEEPKPEPVPEPEPEPEQPPPEEQGPPAPDPEELKRKEEERIAAEQAEQQKKEREQLEAEKQEQERLVAEKKEAEKQAAAKAAAEKVAAEKAAAEKRAAEKKKADDARKAAEEKARQAAQEELRRSLEAEERGNAARNSAEANRWYASIVAKIERAWIKPPSAVPGVTCVVLVSQVPGGEVTSVRVSSCSVSDAALRESVEAAVYRASPLPTPPQGVPFERNLELTFAPNQ
ncbi:MAG TPA: cell envelope integrity protein TolA [Steroidobacteraceae bacterium]|nr:cell envelope integrity protein TolA [Steroidobacteraceae bacterium]